MNELHRIILTLRLLPAKLTYEWAAVLLGVGKDDMPILVKAGLIKPLGRPADSSVKYVATIEILRLSKDLDFLNRATRAIYEFWAKKNANRHSKKP